MYTQSSVEDVSNANEKVDNDLDFIRHWSTKFGLSVNPTKWQVIVVASEQMLNRLDMLGISQVVYQNLVILPSTVEKNWGYI